MTGRDGRLRRFYKQNRPQQLRGFYHVAVTGSFSAAAERMGLGQPAVSLQVQALEQELQARLFERRRGSVTLTPEGEILFEIAVPLVEALESLDEAFRERLGQFEAGRVTCAATDNMIQLVFPPLLERFTSRFPGIELVLYSGNSSQAVQMVVQGIADLGIGMLNAVPRHVRFQPLASFDNYLVVPRNHALAARESVSLEDVARCPLVAPVEQGSLWQTIHRRFARRELQPRVVMRVASTLARLRYVEAGLGVTITSVSDVPADLARALVWLSLSDELPRTAFGLITRANSYLSLPAKRFVEFVAQTLPGVLAARANAAGVPGPPRVTSGAGRRPGP
jgi:DNA-binding transcriptional LysR family regulator